MQFPESWLRTLADPPLSSQALCDALTMAGLEVEERSAAAPAFAGVVVGRIVALAAHPDADRLRVATVDAGGEPPLTVVCGAPNAAVGMLVPLARVGATLPGGVTIREASMRGVTSHGMLCSAKELGLDDDASGLLALPAEAKPGADLREALALDDTLITLKLTPNRADCLSILGIARETAAITGVPLRPPAISPVPASSSSVHRVRVEEPAACPRFASRVVEGVNPGAPTPAWMKARLAACGLRPISAIVDITNYVMLELGQPLHAYDRARLAGDVVVRFAKPGEGLLLLNGDTLALDADLLMVCDEEKPIGLAGIMGGEYSGIGEATRNVLVEGAFWNPVVIQGRMRRLGFVSDAGYRFERGVDFELPPRAVERAVELIVAICGGRAGPLDDRRSELPARTPVRVRPARVRRLLGIEPPLGEIEAVFHRLGFGQVREGEDLVVTPPSYRFDLAIEEDFVEEVARIHGFDRIPSTTPLHRPVMAARPESRRTLAGLRRTLVARDWQEVITFGFVDSRVEAIVDPRSAPVRVTNPIAAQYDVMRRTLLPGLVATLATNLARKVARVRIFEAGRVFDAARADEASQPRHLGGLAYGDALPLQWGQSARGVDVFDVKGDLQALAHPASLATAAEALPWLHPGRSARVDIDGRPAGWLGELHPRLARALELPASPVVFEIRLDALLAVPLPEARPVSRQPILRRDIALVVDEAVAARALVEALVAEKPSFVESIQPFDVYRGPGLEAGRKSLAILVLMQDTARTLTDADGDAAVALLVEVARRRFGATLRS